MTYSLSKFKDIFHTQTGIIMNNDIIWKLEVKQIKHLVKHSKNPRTLTRQQFEHIEKSLKRFGLIDKPCVNLDNTIIGGHQRIEVLKHNKIKEVECWIPNRQLEEKDLDDLNLILNRVHGDFDYDELANHYSVPDLLECGFNVEEIQYDPIEDVEEKEELADESHKCEMCGQKLNKGK